MNDKDLLLQNKDDARNFQQGIANGSITISEISEIVKLGFPIMPKEEKFRVTQDFINNELIPVSGIAKIACKTPQAINSIIKHNGDFPSEIKIADTSYYVKREVIEWLINNHKINRSVEDTIAPEFYFGATKTIAIVGAAGAGKSTILTRMCDEVIIQLLRKIISSGGAAFTESNCVAYLRAQGDINYVVFHYGEGEGSDVPIKLEESNLTDIISAFEKNRERARMYREANDAENLAATYAEFFLVPNEWLKDMMQRLNLRTLKVIDTPGIDENHSGEALYVSDVILLVLNDRCNMEDIASKIKNNIIPKTGASQYIYLYNNRYSMDSDDVASCNDEYDEILKESQLDLDSYIKPLKALRESLVIGNSLSACDVLGTLICVPSFTRSKGFMDKFFFGTLIPKLEGALKNNQYFLELNAFNQANEESFLEIINKTMVNVVNSISFGNEYNFQKFIDEEHWRTKSNDDYRIERAYYDGFRNLKDLIFSDFSQYRTDDPNIDDNFASIIRMAYLALDEALKNKVSLGCGTHHFEDTSSPTQMICEELIFPAKKCEFSNSDDYVDALCKYGVKSNSWNRVECTLTDWNYAKIRCVRNTKLFEAYTNSLEDYIKICHFVPSIVIQAILVVFKIVGAQWDQSKVSEYNRVANKVMANVNIPRIN